MTRAERIATAADVAGMVAWSVVTLPWRALQVDYWLWRWSHRAAGLRMVGGRSVKRWN